MDAISWQYRTAEKTAGRDRHSLNNTAKSGDILFLIVPSKGTERFTMNKMQNFFTATDIDTISECLNGMKLLDAFRANDNTLLLTFESTYEGYSNLLTITPDGYVVGTFPCDGEQQPQSINDNPTATDIATLVEDKKLSLMCSISGPAEEDISGGVDLTFLDYKENKADTLLRITPALVDGTPIIKVEVQNMNQQ